MKNQILLAKLTKYKDKLEKVEEFANKLPLFAEYICNKEIIEVDWNILGNKYKHIYLAWNIKYILFDGKKRKLTNEYKNNYPIKLFEIYINTPNLYGLHTKFGLFNKVSKYCYYINNMNTYFYIKPDNIKDFLDALNNWYLEARKLACEEKKIIEKQKLLDQLSKLENNC